MPHRLIAVDAGSSHDVVLQPCATCRVAVVDATGAPVAGFSVALSRRDLPTTPDCTIPGAVYHGYGGVERQADPACFGRTDRGGLLVFDDLLRGRHHVSANLDHGPFLIANASECLAVDAPGEVTIVTRDLWAAVVEFVGDAVLTAGFDTGPSSSLGWVSHPANILAVRHATARLEALHPNCHVLVGDLAPGREPNARIAVCGATSGWSTRTVPLSRLHETARQTLFLEPGLATAPARTRVHLVDSASGDIADCDGARVDLGWRIDGVTLLLAAGLGVEVQIPAGPYDISASGELPPGCFPTTRRTASPGSLDVVRIPIGSALRRYAVEVRRPDGSPPGLFGLSISWLDAIRTESVPAWRGGRPTSSMLTVFGNRHTFLSTAPVHSCRIYVRGYEPHALDIRAGSGTAAEGVETFVATLPVPRD
ncbi:MAG: hypothetical protein KF830_12520 [Planctomycetes bacterium]|nr:hypothetical protein [Planctomycetota bacterium]